MRLDGFNPYSSLPERSSRAVANTSGNSAPASVPGSEQAGVAANRLPSAQVVPSSAATAEYIPARRESYEPVYGRANQALASYQNTANMAADSAADTLAGIDVYA